MSRETLYIFFILAKRNCHSSNSCQIDNINIFLNKKQPFSKLKNLIPTSKYKTLRLTGYSWGITDPKLIMAGGTRATTSGQDLYTFMSCLP